MTGLVLDQVSKTFAGKKVVDKVSLKLDKPGVYGLLGTNGAGKTTTIRMLLGIINKDSGEITWNGQAVNRKDVNFGYLPEERGVYPKTKILDQLIYFAELKGMNKVDAEKSIRKWAKRLKVEEYLEMPAEKLSKGNQQKIQFMTAIIHDPDLVVLDEPFSGLDPVNTTILKDIIINLVKAGKYVIMSAHQMATIEEFCSDILILNKGKTVLQGNLKDIKAAYPANRVEIDVDEDINKYISPAKLTILNEKNHQYTLRISNEAEAENLLKQLVENHIKINRFEILKPTLNDIFIEKVGATSEANIATPNTLDEADAIQNDAADNQTVEETGAENE
jgi:ABC-2 type transport system ATP-binding protein